MLRNNGQEREEPVRSNEKLRAKEKLCIVIAVFVGATTNIRIRALVTSMVAMHWRVAGIAIEAKFLVRCLRRGRAK